MLAYIVRRLLFAPLLLITVSLITFTLGQYGPGDPIEVLMGQHSDPEVVARVRHQRGLDRPFHVQYLDYVWKVLHGDFGESYKFRGEAVMDLLLPRIAVSAQLGLVALVMSLGIGIPLGLLAAMKQGSWGDLALVSGSLFFYAVPAVITAPIILFLLAYQARVLPSFGWGGILDARIVMPALVMGLPGIAVLVRLMRASTLDVKVQDYVRTARAKGLEENVVLFRHVARNALLPVFTVVGMSLVGLLEGAFITETFFGIPGVGRLTVDSLFARDYPVIMAMGLITASAWVVSNLIVDIGYTFLDPRIRYS